MSVEMTKRSLLYAMTVYMISIYRLGNYLTRYLRPQPFRVVNEPSN